MVSHCCLGADCPALSGHVGEPLFKGTLSDPESSSHWRLGFAKCSLLVDWDSGPVPVGEERLSHYNIAQDSREATATNNGKDRRREKEEKNQGPSGP